MLLGHFLVLLVLLRSILNQILEHEMLKPQEHYFWNHLLQEIEGSCINVAGYILDYVEHENLAGFRLTSKNGKLYIKALMKDGKHPKPRSETLIDVWQEEIKNTPLAKDDEWKGREGPTILEHNFNRLERRVADLENRVVK